MIEAEGNLWSFMPDADVRVITTNGSIKGKGSGRVAVMGRGCAYEAARQFPDLPSLLARRLDSQGNTLFMFEPNKIGSDFVLVTFPVKHDWHQNADEDLIFRSACQLADLADFNGWAKIICPRFGCGAGNLDWEQDVKPLVKRILDDRFHILDFRR